MNRIQVLVVEDDAPVRNLITTTLKTHEYKYMIAKDGNEAIRNASTYNPDVLFLDLGLPDIDGIDVIKKVREWSNMPIIVISARSDDEDISRNYAAFSSSEFIKQNLQRIIDMLH